MVEFLETFETHLSNSENRQTDGKVTLEEFTEYYRNISSSIDNDQYFNLMMNNSWNLKGDSAPYQKYQKAWANEGAKAPAKAPPKKLGAARAEVQQVQRSGVMSRDNPLCTDSQAYYQATASASLGSKTNMI